MTSASPRDPRAEQGWQAATDVTEPPRRSPRVRAAVSGMVVLVLVGFSAAVIAAIITPGGERVSLSSGASEAGEHGDGGQSDPLGPTASEGADPSEATDRGSAGVPGVDTVVVHVSGAVAQPGVIELVLGSRVVDAIAHAGGPDDSADLAALNLARPLVDGEQVHIPREGESPPGGAAAPGASSGGGVGGGGLVNINTAGAMELETLAGVGPALASRIIAWREQNGSFRSVDELLAVSGIGDKTLAGFRDQVTV